MKEKIFNILLSAHGSIKPEHHPNILTARIIEAICEEIMKVENPYRVLTKEGYTFADCRQKILSLLQGKENDINTKAR